MPETMNENDHSADKTEKEFPSVYFASSIRNHVIAVLGAVFFLILGCFILNNGNTLAGCLCFAGTVVFIGDFLDMVIVGSENIYRTHFYHVSSAIARESISICSTSKEKSGDQIYLYGFGAHMTMLRSKRLWKKLMEVIGIPEEVREKLDTCPNDLYEEKLTPELLVRSQRVMIDYLIHSANYVSIEIRRTFPKEYYEKMGLAEDGISERDDSGEILEGEEQSQKRKSKPRFFERFATVKNAKAVRLMRAFVLIPLLVILGILGVFYMWYNSVAKDLCILSFDQSSQLVIADITHKDDRTKLTQKGDHDYQLWLTPTEKQRFYHKFIKNAPNYIYSVEPNNTKQRTESGIYVFYYKHRYYAIEEEPVEDGESGEDGKFICREMACYGTLPVVASNSQDEVAAILPLRAGIKSPLRLETAYYTWDDTYGMNSYEDLASFYERIGEEYYTLKEEEKTIYVSIYVNQKWYPDALRIETFGSGFEVHVEDAILKK